MKNIGCLLLLLLVQLSAKAQTEKGRWSAGVSLGSFTYQNEDYGRYFSGSLSPSAGYFVANNLMVGAGVPLSYNTQTLSASSVNQKTRSFSIGVSPFARYYIGASKLKPNVGFAFSFSRNNYHSFGSANANSLESVTISNALTITPSVGVAYFLNQHVSLDARLGYNWYRTVTKTASPTGDGLGYTSQNITLGLGFNIFFGG